MFATKRQNSAKLKIKISGDKNEGFKSRLGLGACPKFVLSLLLATPLSQIYADEDRSALEEVVVTAQKKEQSLMDAAIDVTAFSGEQLTVSGIDDVFGISKAIPGLTIQNTGANPQIFMREWAQGSPAQVWTAPSLYTSMTDL